MGKVISFLERKAAGPPLARFLYGAAITLFTVALFAAPVYLLLAALEEMSMVAYVLVGAFLLKSTFSLKGLRRAALRVKALLADEKTGEARRELGSLVSRDTATLPPPLMVSAAVESVAENASDSFVAPLFYFLLFGVPGAIAYRAVNTLDAMIGYHGKYEYLGKFAAKLDDVLNFIPARLTALLLVLAAFLKADGWTAWRTAWGHHSRTESPNAGWPMAALAGALNVRLEKVGHYSLGETGAPLTPETIAAASRLTLTAMTAWIIVCFTGVTAIVLASQT